MRKKIIEKPAVGASASRAAVGEGGELDLEAIATVEVSSESPGSPIENAFDGTRGPGASRWVAGEPGAQTIVLAFDVPQRIARMRLEIEEATVARTQELDVAISTDGGTSYRELLRQEFNFSPGGATFEREEWTLDASAVTQLRLRIRPDKGGRPLLATVTSLSLT